MCVVPDSDSLCKQNVHVTSILNRVTYQTPRMTTRASRKDVLLMYSSKRLHRAPYSFVQIVGYCSAIMAKRDIAHDGGVQDTLTYLARSPAHYSSCAQL